MPGARLPMRKIRDVLRLTAAGMSSRQVAAHGRQPTPPHSGAAAAECTGAEAAQPTSGSRGHRRPFAASGARMKKPSRQSQGVASLGTTWGTRRPYRARLAAMQASE